MYPGQGGGGGYPPGQGGGYPGSPPEDPFPGGPGYPSQGYPPQGPPPPQIGFSDERGYPEQQSDFGYANYQPQASPLGYPGQGSPRRRFDESDQPMGQRSPARHFDSSDLPPLAYPGQPSPGRSPYGQPSPGLSPYGQPSQQPHQGQPSPRLAYPSPGGSSGGRGGGGGMAFAEFDVPPMDGRYSNQGGEESFGRVELKDDEFSGLIGNIGQIMGGGGGGGGGMGGAGDLIGGLMGGGGAGDIIGGILGGGGGGGGKKKGGLGGLIGGIFGKKKNKHGGGGGSGGLVSVLTSCIGGSKRQRGDQDGGGGAFDDMGGGGGGGGGGGLKFGGIDAGDLIGGIGGLIGGGGQRGQFGGGGGPNMGMGGFKGTAIDLISKGVGWAGHKYLGIDPSTGHIIGSIAGNVIFGLGGKDNGLGNIGKMILDNIISGKFKRNVDPFVPPEPRGGGPAPLPDMPTPVGMGQDFEELRRWCLDNKVLFEDPQFPPTEASLFFSKAAPMSVEWLRPGEIVKEPQLFVEGHHRFDVVQGELGDCWLLAAAANLTLRDEMFYRVVPPDQSFTENYAGIFHFQFWQYGKWVDVVVDDRLPTSGGKLLYLHSAEAGEFWSALLEKAYAKLHGSYEALKGGTTSEALEDFTGGLTEFFDLEKSPPKNLLAMMFRAFEMGSLLGCSIEADPNQWEARQRNGLVKGHAYSITGMKVLDVGGRKVPLLRIRNPWGNEQEWNGAWSDGSDEWRNVDEGSRQEMGLDFAHDGEFWMSYEDFMREWQKMEICLLGPDVMDEIYEMTGVKPAVLPWSTNNHDAVWQGRSAGGCRNFIETFADNPQFAISLQDSDPGDDDELCTAIIAVLQKNRRQLRHKGLDLLPIGFALYQVDDFGNRQSAGFFKANTSAARSPCFINLREVTGRFRLPPGNYVLVPSTFEPGMEGQFMVRLFTNAIVESQEV